MLFWGHCKYLNFPLEEDLQLFSKSACQTKPNLPNQTYITQPIKDLNSKEFFNHLEGGGSGKKMSVMYAVCKPSIFLLFENVQFSQLGCSRVCKEWCRCLGSVYIPKWKQVVTWLCKSLQPVTHQFFFGILCKSFNSWKSLNNIVTSFNHSEPSR